MNAPPPPPGPPPPSGAGPESFEPRLRGCLAKAAQKVYPTPTWPSPPGEGGQVGVGVLFCSPSFEETGEEKEAAILLPLLVVGLPTAI